MALTDQDLYLFNEGTHSRLYRSLGAHLEERDGRPGCRFAVWAPNAGEVSVIGDFNGWDKGAHRLEARDGSGIWEGFIPGLERGTRYKYHIASRHSRYTVDKADPFGFRHETPPGTASVVWDLDYDWSDGGWMEERGRRNAHDAPMSVYELHPGSWRRPDDPGREFLGYRELADALAEYVADTGFTHVELLPVMEHPFYGSWGYQTTGYFAPTSRYGSPQDLMYLVDTLHQRGIGVILDWVPSHFPTDEHALGYFDGTHLYEHADPKEGFHPDWGSFIFNYGRHEVRSFLLSSALFWLDHYHIDGIRVDAVASMLYRDYSREAGEWIPNEHGGRENLEAIGFLRQLNEVVYGEYPDVQTVAEESTAWPMVSRPTYVGGLGFGMKWDMGWMHDTLHYMARDPVHRSWHHHELTFRMVYAFNENFMLPLSHDEVVHGKGSLLAKMPGDGWRKRANLRLLLGYMWAQPGKKLLFMGSEFGQWREWAHDEGLQWHLLDDPAHEGLRRWVRDLNRLYREEPALHARDFDGGGFEWIEANDAAGSALAFLRKAPTATGHTGDQTGSHGGDATRGGDAGGTGGSTPDGGSAESGGRGPADIMAVLNATPEVRENYRVGVPRAGVWEEVLNSDADVYGGSGRGNYGKIESAPVPYHGRYHSLNLTLPPLSVLFLRAPAPPGRQGRRPADERGRRSATPGATGDHPPGSAPVGPEGPVPVEDVWRDE